MFFESIKPPERLIYDDGSRVVVLRRSRVEDAEVLVDAISDSLPALYRFMPWAHFPRHRTVVSQAERLELLTRKWDEGHDFVFHIFLPQDDGAERFAGCVGFHPRCLHNRGLEVGYWVRSDESGRGLCTLATKMIVWLGFQEMGLKRVQVCCDRGNEGSRRVIEKVGFEYEALLKNMGYCDVPEEVKARGWEATGDVHMHRLIPEEFAALAWPDELSRHLT